MRGTPLNRLRDMLKGEVGYTFETTAQDQELSVLLSNKQKWFAGAYDWPFLTRVWDLAVPAGSRYLTLPTTTNAPIVETADINFERPVKVEVLWSSVWQPVAYGIGTEEYNATDSDTSETMDPIQQIRLATNASDSSANQIEVWPMPVLAQTLRFTGQRDLLALDADSDVADLDDMLFVLTVAAEKLTRLKQPDAPIKSGLALDRLRTIRANYPQREDEPIVLGGAPWRELRRNVPIRVIA